jgi:hypothetical protein
VVERFLVRIGRNRSLATDFEAADAFLYAASSILAMGGVVRSA